MHLHQALDTPRRRVLDLGRIIEQGTHAELIAAGGTYADLFSKQAANYQHSEQPARGTGLPSGPPPSGRDVEGLGSWARHTPSSGQRRPGCAHQDRSRGHGSRHCSLRCRPAGRTGSPAPDPRTATPSTCDNSAVPGRRRRSPSTTVSPTASTTMAIRSQTTRSSYPPGLAGPPFSGASPSGRRWYRSQPASRVVGLTTIASLPCPDEHLRSLRT